MISGGKMKITCYLIIFLLIFTNCGPTKMETELQQLIDKHVTEIAPIFSNMNSSYWDAAISGDKEASEKSH